MIFNHQNIAPFISKQLIQKLVTSNPSKSYIQEVAEVFNDNGEGVRGDMKAVIKAILLSPYALQENNSKSTFGKLKEPILFISQLLRSLEATSNGYNYIIDENNNYEMAFRYNAFNLQRLSLADVLQQPGILQAH